MCVYNRPHYLPITLEAFRKQTVKFPFIIVNNNPQLHDEFARIVDQADIEQVSLVHSDHNIGGFARYFTARDCASTKHVIFIDDDQGMKPTMIEHLAANAVDGIAGLWCFNYRDSANTRDRVTQGNAQYVGTGGQVALRTILRVLGSIRNFQHNHNPSSLN